MSAADLIKFAPTQKYFEYDYLKALCRMLPLGNLWVTTLKSLESIPEHPEGHNTFVSMLSCFAAELARLEYRAIRLFHERIPGLAVETLSDWERVAGLPEFGQSLPSTIAARQNQVHAKLYTSNGQGLTVNYYISYAYNMGFDIRIYENTDVSKPFIVGPSGPDTLGLGSRMGDRLGNKGQVGAIIIRVLGGLDGTENLQAIFEIIKPGHTVLIWEGLIYNRSIIYNFDLYTFSEPTIGTLSSPIATDSSLYADDHANLITAYGLKEFTTQYADSGEYKRAVNVAYTWGPADFSGAIVGFDYLWAIYSTVSGGLYAKRLDTGTAIDLKVQYPTLGSLVDSIGFTSILTATFDMSGSLLVAFECPPDETGTSVKIWSPDAGAYQFYGYSPLLICNESYVPGSNPDSLLFDSILLYMDENGDNSGWNYNEVERAADQWEFDERYSRTVKARFQRNDFEDIYTLFTTDYDIAYIESAWFDGDPDDFITPDDIGREYCLYVSVRGVDKARRTYKSAPYYLYNFHDVSISDTSSISAGITSGELFETLVLNGMQEDDVAIAASISGSIESTESKWDGAGTPDTASISASVSGALSDAIVTDGTQTETSSITAGIDSGKIETGIGGSSSNTETSSMSASIASGIIETVEQG